MKLDKCDVYTAKETLGYRGRKRYMATVKSEENQRVTIGETNPQINNQRSSKEKMKKRTETPKDKKQK